MACMRFVSARPHVGVQLFVQQGAPTTRSPSMWEMIWLQIGTHGA